MKHKGLLVVIFSTVAAILGINPRAAAQSFEWKAGAYAFFDDGEYVGLDNRYSQTMAGFRLSPEIGFSYKDFSLFAGAHLQTEFGSPAFLDYTYFTGYFQYNTDPRVRASSPASPYGVRTSRSACVSSAAGAPLEEGADREVRTPGGGTPRVYHHFLFGSFPRQGLLDEYTTFYIRDTFHYYRPNIMGIYYKLSGAPTEANPHAADNYLKLWLDWTGHQSPTVRETFFAGLSAQYAYRWFFAALNGYYYHYAKTHPNSGDGFVHDNGQGQIGLGIDFSERINRLHYARFQAAFMMGYECKRDHVTPVKMPMGMVLDLHVQYWRIGTRTLYYYGQPRYTVPTDNFSNTYWGDAFLSAAPAGRTHSYLCSQWYVSLFRNAVVEAKAAAEFNLKDTKFGSRYYVQLSVNLSGAVHTKHAMQEEGFERATYNFTGADAWRGDLY